MYILSSNSQFLQEKRFAKFKKNTTFAFPTVLQLRWQSKGLKILVSAVRFFPAPQKATLSGRFFVFPKNQLAVIFLFITKSRQRKEFQLSPPCLIQTRNCRRGRVVFLRVCQERIYFSLWQCFNGCVLLNTGICTGKSPAPHLLWRCNCEESGNFDRPAMKSVRKTALLAHQLQYFSNPCANKAFLRTDYFCLELEKLKAEQ